MASITEKRSYSRIIDRDCYYNEWCQKGYNFNGNCVENKCLHHVSGLIKPCSVALIRLDLLGHNGNALSDCCHAFPEVCTNKESATNKTLNNLELANSVVENLPKRDEDTIRSQMQLLFKSLCETIRLIDAKKQKSKVEKKVECNILSASTSENREIKNASTKLIDTLQQRKKIIKTSKISKPFVINSTFDSEVSQLLKLRTKRRCHEKQHFEIVDENCRQPVEGNAGVIENILPSYRNNKSMQIKYLSSNEMDTNFRNKTNMISKINDSSMFANQKHYCITSCTGSKIEFLSKKTGKMAQNKAMQTDSLTFSPNKSALLCVSNPEAKVNEKTESAFYENNEVEIEILDEPVVQKNFKTTSQVGTNTEIIHKNSDWILSNKLQSIIKANNVLDENRDIKSKILKEQVVNENLIEKTKTSPFDINSIKIIKNKNGSEGQYLEYTDGERNKQMKMLNEVETPCNVYLSCINGIACSCNKCPLPAVSKKETKSNFSKMKSVNECRISSGPSSNLSLSKVDKVSSILAVSEFSESNKHALNVPKTLLIKPCSVAVQKLPIDNCLKLMDSKTVSFCNKIASCPVIRDEIEGSNSQLKMINECSINSYPSSLNLTSTTPQVKEISNAGPVSICDVINGQSIKECCPLVEPCSVVVHKLSADECLKLISVGKSHVNKENSALKFKKKSYSILKKRKLMFLHKRNIIKKYSLLNKVYGKKICKISVHGRQTMKQKTTQKQNDLEMGNFDRNKSGRVHKVFPFPLRENPHIYNTSTIISPKCPLRYVGANNNFNCSVLLERINIAEYLLKNKKLFNEFKKLMESRPVVKNKMGQDSVPNSSRRHLKRERQLCVEGTSQFNAKKIKIKPTSRTLEKNVDSVKSVRNAKNIICDPDYKCAQCQKSVVTDIELYYHLCRGKRDKGFVCDFCEKIFETIPGLRRHVNFHLKFTR